MIHEIKELVWGPWLMVLMLAVGLFYSFRSRFFQIRSIGVWWRGTAGSVWKSRGKDKADADSENEGVSPFQAACTALAATVGTGNIAGVATALAAGGAGAIFWMWVSAFVGMMTAYGENVLGILYRIRGKDGKWQCGPMIYIERGLGMKPLAVLYALFAVLASLGMGSMVQSNSMAETLKYTFHIPPFWTGLALTFAAALVLWGGIGRIAQVTEKLIPFAAGFYIILSMIVILANIDRVPAAFGQIFHQALTPSAALGGAIGYGISRGIFSNEAGLGSLSILHGSAENVTPQQQGMWGIFDVFFDTIVICTMTALVILCQDAGGHGIPPELDGAAMAAWAFSETIGIGGEIFISLSMVCFAFATIIGWYYLGSQAASYLTNGNIFIYRLFYLEAVFFGCVLQMKMVWELSDIFNGLMALPNLAALILLYRKAKLKPGELPVKQPLDIS